MRSLIRFTVVVLAGACLLGNAAGADPVTRQRLASELTRAATMRLASDPMTVNAVNIAALLIEEALALDSEKLERWQVALDFALLAENDSLRDRAVENILRLDPRHEPVRLMRLNAAIEQRQTFDQRIEAYELLLKDENINHIGPAVASRLALDAALLQQRQGNVEQFTHWLTKALAWDASNRTAAAIAAGFFAMNVDDPVAQAELLVNLMLADPTDAGTQVELGQRLIENGAFAGAERMYQLAIRSLTADAKDVFKSLIIDYALALWGNGKEEDALGVLSRRQNELDLSYRLYIREQRPDMTIDQLKALDCPLDQDLAMADAVIRAGELPIAVEGESGAAAFEQARSRSVRAIRAFQGSIDIANEMASLPESEGQGYVYEAKDVAQDFLKMAWLALWMGVHVEDVEKWLASAQDLAPMEPLAKDRFAGWLAIRRGDLAGAQSLLAPLAQSDIAAELGMAQIQLEQGENSEAARTFLAVARRQPGSLIGLWARSRFEAIVGTAVPPTEQSLVLERLIASVSTQFDRCADDPSLAITLRVTPAKVTFEPFEPLLYTIELTNNTPYPLALDRNGPLRPQLLMLCTVRSSLSGGSGDLRPFVIDLHRLLRLAPRQRLVITFDLRDHWPGVVINAHALDGAIVRLRCQMNFGVNPAGVATARLYGQEIEAAMIRVDGIRMSALADPLRPAPAANPGEWLISATGELATLTGPPLLELMAMMTHRVAARPAQPLPDNERDILYAARLALAERFAQLDGDSQAWVLAVMASGAGLAIEGLGPIHALARSSENRLVIMCNLLFHAVGARDPMYEAAMRHDDAVVRRMAEMLHDDAVRHEEATAGVAP